CCDRQGAASGSAQATSIHQLMPQGVWLPVDTINREKPMSTKRNFLPRSGFARLRSFVAIVAMAATTTVTAQDPVTVTDFELPPQDMAGWTTLQPSADSRLIYIDSENGSDASGAFHLPSDAQVGANPQMPAGEVRAFRTLAAASAQLRED